jgi:type VI secretion system protein ImpC
VLDVLHALRDRSLLRTLPVGDGVRFAHYEIVRAFAREALDRDGGGDGARARHRGYYLERAGDAELARRSRDADNLRAIHRDAVTDGRGDDALRAALALDPVLAARGPVEQHLELLEHSLRVAGDGGDPYGCLVGDYEFDKGPQDMELVESITTVAAAAHAPFIAAAGPGMFGMESFTQMPDPRDLAKIFDKTNPENTKWLSFRDSEDSRFCTLTLPHVLMRLPYGDDNPVDDFHYIEDVDGNEHDKYLWGNAAFAFAGRLTDSFAKYNWCVAIRGPEGGGLVEGLPIHVFRSREGDIGSKCPTEVLIPDTREKELSDLGFVPLIHCKNTDYAAFFGANSVQRPKKYDDAAATANAKLSTQTQYLMATSRIAHYLKAICRDKVGSFMSRSDCEKFLNRWILNYVLGQDNATQAQKARRPLREARIDVTDDKANPGCYRAIAYMKPHFQLEELNVSLRLVADLPASVK